MSDHTEIESTKALAHLSRLVLTEKQLVKFSGELQQVFSYISEIDQAQGAQSQTKTISLTLCEDALRMSDDPLQTDREILLAAVPNSKDGLIKVRAVL